MVFAKNAMKLHFDKSFDPTFLKVGQGVGVKPQGLKFDNYCFDSKRE